MLNTSLHRFLRRRGRTSSLWAIYYLRSRGSKTGGRRRTLIRALLCSGARNEGRTTFAPRALDKDGALIAVWDLKVKPLNTVEVLYWQLILQEEANRRHLKHIDVYLSPICLGSDQEPENQRSIMEMRTLFYLNPLLRNLHIYQDQTLFEDTFSGNEDHELITQDALNELASTRLDHFQLNHSGPSLTPQMQAGVLQRALGIGFRKDSFFIGVHAEGWDDQTAARWIEFIQKVGRALPQVVFLLVGQPNEHFPSLLSEFNVFSTRGYGFYFLEEVVIIREADLYMGLDNGYAPVAVFSNIPYLLFKSPKDTPSLTTLRGEHTASERFPFAVAHQRLHGEWASAQDLYDAFKSLYQVLKSKSPSRYDAHTSSRSGGSNEMVH